MSATFDLIMKIAIVATMAIVNADMSAAFSVFSRTFSYIELLFFLLFT
jgi:hypothetical protein